MIQITKQTKWIYKKLLEDKFQEYLKNFMKSEVYSNFTKKEPFVRNCIVVHYDDFELAVLKHTIESQNKKIKELENKIEKNEWYY